MKLDKVLILVIGLLFFLSTANFDISAQEKDKYEPTWESLMDYNGYPQWYNDAVLGFYFHWGPYTVPGFGCAGYWTMY